MYPSNNIRRAAALSFGLFFVSPALAQVPLKIFGYPVESKFGQPVTIFGEIDGRNSTLQTGTMEFGRVELSGATTPIASPTLSPLRTQDALVSLGQNQTCFVTSTGGAQCFGSSTHAQLGNGSTHATNATTSPVDVTNNTDSVNAVSVGLEHSCVLKDNATVQCWGANYYGQSGNTAGIDRPTPANVNGLTSIRMLDGGEGHNCALDYSGAVFCWGWNVVGQLGIGSTSDSPTPVTPTGLSSGVKQVSAGNFHTCALLLTGSIKCWGWNTSGYVGNGNTTQQTSPVDVVGITDAKAIVAGREHSCAITSTGVKCWGRGVSGQLGNGSSTTSTTPVTVSTLGSNIAALAAGDQFTCALSNTGDVSCWGGNSEGELGNGTNTLSNVPVSVSLGSPAIAISAGSFHACAILESGAMKCWGNNSHGQLGDGTTTDSNVPVVATGVTPLLRSGASIVTVPGHLPAGVQFVQGRVADPGPPQVVRGLGGYVFYVTKVASSVTLSSSSYSVPFGTTITLTATASSEFAPPDGYVEFKAGDEFVGAGVLVNGSFSSLIASLPPGNNQLTAYYLGNDNFNSSTSEPITVTVARRLSTTTITSSLNPSTFGANVTFTAAVSADGGTPTGDVVFKAGTTTLGTGTIDQGSASLTTSVLAVGTQSVSANYEGDSDHGTSTDSLNQTVDKADQTITFTSVAPSAIYGGPRYAPVASATSSLAPTYSIDPSSASVCSIASGLVSFNGTGSCVVVADQAGNGSYNAAQPVTQTVTVTRASTRVTLVATSTNVLRNTPAYLTADVNPVTPSTGTPSGLVTFRRNGVVFGTPVAVDSNGLARITTAALPLGEYQFTASFAESDCCNASVSSALTVRAGFAIGPETRVNTTVANHQTNGTVASFGTGAVAVWESRTTQTAAAIVAQRLSQTGTKLGGEILVAGLSPGATSPQVAGLDNGTFVVVW